MMTKILLSLLFMAGLAITAQATNNPTKDFKVNVAASKVEWKAYKVTGKHNGTVNLKEGSLSIKDGVLTGGSFTMDMTSIKVTDLSPEYAAKLEGHLKSADFFESEVHPTAQLVVTEAIDKAEGLYEVKANLTIRGITQPIQFKVVLTPTGKTYTATADIKIDRTLFDVKYGSGKFFDDLGDKAIYDEFDLVVSIVTTNSSSITLKSQSYP